MLSKTLFQDVCALLDVLCCLVPGDRRLPPPGQDQAPEDLQTWDKGLQGAKEDSGACQGGGGGANTCREEDLPDRPAGC